MTRSGGGGIRRVIVTALIVLSAAEAAAQKEGAPETSPSPATPIIDLYTMGMGDIPVERFGHAAICVTSQRRPRGRCYNYGTTDFTRPLSLTWGFLRGRSKFWVSTQSPARMLALYKRRDRTIWRQRLPLTPEQATQVAAALEESVKEENKYYQYHHYDDNCTTRVRDVIDRATGGALSEGTDVPFPATLRDMSRAGFAEETPLLLASDFILGRRADQEITLYEAMFLPDVLRAEVENRLGAEPVVVYERRGRPLSTENNTARTWLLLGAVLFAIPAWVTWFLGRRERLGAFLSLTPALLLGLVVWFIAIVSPLREGRINEVLLVLWPVDVLAFFMSPDRRRSYARMRVAGLCLVGLLAAIGILKQPLWVAIPFSLLPILPLALPPRQSGAAASEQSSSSRSTSDH